MIRIKLNEKLEASPDPKTMGEGHIVFERGDQEKVWIKLIESLVTGYLL